MNTILCDTALVSVLLIARYVFEIECFEWYCPRWLDRWLTPSDLTDSGTILGVED